MPTLFFSLTTRTEENASANHLQLTPSIFKPRLLRKMDFFELGANLSCHSGQALSPEAQKLGSKNSSKWNIMMKKKHRYLTGKWYTFCIILQFGVFLSPNLNFWPSSPHRCSTQVAVARLRVTFPIFIGVVICSELLEGQNAWLTESCTSWRVCPPNENLQQNFWCNLKKPTFPRAGLHHKLNQTGMKNLIGKNQRIIIQWNPTDLFPDSVSHPIPPKHSQQVLDGCAIWQGMMVSTLLQALRRARKKDLEIWNLHVSNFSLVRPTVINQSNSNGKECDVPQRQATTPTWSWPML